MTRKIGAPPSKPPSTPHTSEISRALVPISSRPNAWVPQSSPPEGKIPPTPSDPSMNSSQEIEWKEALENLERQMISYRDLAKEGKATEQDAERVSEAFQRVANSHTDPKVQDHFKQKANEFREADPEEREEILGNIFKGFLTLLATPFLAVGAALFTAGMILRGIGLGLKFAGQFAVKKFWGGLNRSLPPPASGDSTSRMQ